MEMLYRANPSLTSKKDRFLTKLVWEAIFFER
jgi:hypothetical protein